MAKGGFYIDDGTTHDYKEGMFAATDFEYKAVSATLSIISGQPTDGGVYDAKNWIEKIVVRGVHSSPSSISVVLEIMEIINLNAFRLSELPILLRSSRFLLIHRTRF